MLVAASSSQSGSLQFLLCTKLGLVAGLFFLYHNPMIIKSITQTSYEGMYKITPGEGPAFFARQEYVPGVVLDELVAGSEVSPEHDDVLLDAGLAAAVELKTVTYLARAEQCRAGLTKKLIEKKYDKKYVGMALDYLEKRGYLSDERFARAWLHDRKINHYEGRTKLSGELAARGIGREVATAALDEFFTENDEAQICQKAYEKFTRQGKEGEKLMAAMIRAGFTYKMIKDTVQ